MSDDNMAEVRSAALANVARARVELKRAQTAYDTRLGEAVHAGLSDRQIGVAVGLQPDAIRMWRSRQARRRRRRR